MSILDTPEKYLSNVEGKSYTSKGFISSLNSYLTLFSRSVCAIYYKGYRTQKKSLVLKLCIPGINS